MMHFIELFGLPYLVCLTMIGILGHLGIHVLKREVIFIDIALAQVVAVGAIVAHLLFGVHGDSMLAYACAFGFALMAAAFYSIVRRKVVQIPLEAVIGVTYAIAAAAALFLVGIAPGGHLHVQQMLAGSILWVTWKDLLLCVIVFLTAGFAFYLFREPFRKISDDYESAMQEGMSVVWWDFLFYSLLGLVITIAVQIGGVVVVFAFLIIPATASALFSSNWRTRLIIAWTIGAAASMMGLLFADVLDFSIGPAVAMFLGVALVLSAFTKVLRRSLAVTVVGLIVLGFAALLVFGRTAALPVVSHRDVSGLTDSKPGVETAIPDHRPHPARSPSSEEIAGMNDLAEIERLFKQAVDADVANAIVCRALELHPPTGARLALDFMEGDPPFFFRQQVTIKLDEFMGQAAGFDPEEPFSNEVNQKAAAKVKKLFGLE